MLVRIDHIDHNVCVCVCLCVCECIMLCAVCVCFCVSVYSMLPWSIARVRCPCAVWSTIGVVYSLHTSNLVMTIYMIYDLVYTSTFSFL